MPSDYSSSGTPVSHQRARVSTPADARRSSKLRSRSTVRTNSVCSSRWSSSCRCARFVRSNSVSRSAHLDWHSANFDSSAATRSSDSWRERSIWRTYSARDTPCSSASASRSSRSDSSARTVKFGIVRTVRGRVPYALVRRASDTTGEPDAEPFLVPPCVGTDSKLTAQLAQKTGGGSPVYSPTAGISLSLTARATGVASSWRESATDNRYVAAQSDGTTSGEQRRITDRRILMCPACGRIDSIREDWGICAECAGEVAA